MVDKTGTGSKAAADREARRAAELRANLKKRKNLARVRASDAAPAVRGETPAVSAIGTPSPDGPLPDEGRHS